jgi:hypothetical protein
VEVEAEAVAHSLRLAAVAAELAVKTVVVVVLQGCAYGIPPYVRTYVLCLDLLLLLLYVL